MKKLNESIDFTARIMAFIILFAAASAIAGGLSFLLILFLSFHLMPIKAGNPDSFSFLALSELPG